MSTCVALAHTLTHRVVFPVTNPITVTAFSASVLSALKRQIVISTEAAVAVVSEENT